jgi:hypothetical protein
LSADRFEGEMEAAEAEEVLLSPPADAPEATAAALSCRDPGGCSR